MQRCSFSRVASPLVLVAYLACQSGAPADVAPQPSVDAPPKAVSAEDVVPLDQVEQAAFSLVWSSPPATVGESVQGTLTLNAKAPFKCNQEYPFKVKLDGKGVRPTASEVTKAAMQVAPDKVVVPVQYTVQAPGAAQLEATFALSVCTDEKCLIERQAIRMSVQGVSPSAAPSTTAEAPTRKQL